MSEIAANATALVSGAHTIKLESITANTSDNSVDKTYRSKNPSVTSITTLTVIQAADATKSTDAAIKPAVVKSHQNPFAWHFAIKVNNHSLNLSQRC